ncbi:two component transcriptional regulator, LuxR family [bacterium A37T11]|nr:two component transcriptional regulator, LuxR family [bacterium A37T11]
METILVSIVEDISDIRDGMRMLLEQTPGFECLDTYENAEEAFKGLSKRPPHIAIIDIALPGDNGVSCIRKLRESGSKIQFMVFTIFESSEQVFEALAAGANGYLLKDDAPEKILEGLRELSQGGSPMSISIARKVVSSFHHVPGPSPLSPREMEVLQLLSKGLLYKEIAEKLFISTGTVRQHIHHIYDRLHVQNRTEALNKVFGQKNL